ncbi:unnamed protein product [Medioppia subpectinata]|uniref:Uncharacterized protein n=1 Tax=Medioppia subpectinata TaxID=1979941 RepID=A0A7R9KTY9_9ACAR|nr:unnamed protein product [Medioppia subpectinata]CAG2109822.1 unnamed protein product [Medioppia subpectinata]
MQFKSLMLLTVLLVALMLAQVSHVSAGYLYGGPESTHKSTQLLVKTGIPKYSNWWRAAGFPTNDGKSPFIYIISEPTGGGLRFSDLRFGFTFRRLALIIGSTLSEEVIVYSHILLTFYATEDQKIYKALDETNGIYS